MDPVGVELNDRKTVEDIFPLEVWSTIFSFAALDDVLTCTRANLTWSRLLEQKKPTIMMAKVFQFINEYIQPMDVFNCRRICKSWKNSVDSFLNSDGYHFPNTHAFSHTSTAIRIGNHFTPQNINERYDSLNNVCRIFFDSNVFKITRHISYKEDLRDDIDIQDVARNRLTWFFQRFGSQIWHCRLKFSIIDEYAMSNRMIPNSIVHYLVLMPNLKSLSIQLEHPRGNCTHDEWRLLNLLHRGFQFSSLEFLIVDTSPKYLGFGSIDFILQCPTIQHIFFKILIDSSIRPTGKIQFRGYEDFMYTSNIWRLVPTLKSIRIFTEPVKRLALKRSGEGGACWPSFLPEEQYYYTREDFNKIRGLQQ